MADGNFTGSNYTINVVDNLHLYQVVIPVLCSIAFVSLLLNCIIVISSRWIRHKMTPNLRLSVSLAAADALTSALFIVGLIVNSYLPMVCGWLLSHLDCLRLFLETLRLGAVITSVLHLLLLSVNQLVGIVQPLRYRRIISTRVVNTAIIGVWLVPTMGLNIFFALLSPGGYRATNCRTEILITFPFRICVFLPVLIPFVIIWLIYIAIVILLKRIQGCYAHQQLSPPQQIRKNVRMAKTTLLIIGTFALGWLPGSLLFILVCRDCLFDVFSTNRTVLATSAIVMNVLIIVKLMINPFVYAFRILELRYALWLMRKSFFGLKEQPDLYHCSVPQEFLKINMNAAVIVSKYSVTNSNQFSTSIRYNTRMPSRQQTVRIQRQNEAIQADCYDSSNDVML